MFLRPALLTRYASSVVSDSRLAPGRGPSRAPASGVDRAAARVVALLLLAIPVLAVWYVVTQVLHAPPSAETQQLATLDPRTLFGSDNADFLPTPVAAIPADKNTGPPAPAASEANGGDTDSGTAEQVKVANTGGLGAILRSDPPKGRQVAALREGQVLQVIEHQTVDGDDWVHVRTQDGTEGWVYGRLVGPVQ